MTDKTNNTKDKDTDSWGTPHSVYDFFDDIYEFAMDIAASKENSKHERFLSVENSAFDFDFSTIDRGNYLWCNPPYSDVMPWIKLAVKNTDIHGLGTVMLLKHDCSTRWYSELLKYADKIIEVTDGRLPFQCYKTGKMRGGNNFPSMFAIFHRPINRRVGTNKTPRRLYVERDVLMSYRKSSHK